MKCPTCGKDPEVNVEDRRQLLNTGKAIGREEVKRGIIEWLREKRGRGYADALSVMVTDELADR